MTGTGFANPRVWTWLAIALVASWVVVDASPLYRITAGTPPEGESR